MNKRDKLINILEKKRYTKFLKDLSAANETHLQALIEKTKEMIDKFVFINNNLYYLNNVKAELIQQTKTDMQNTLQFELGFLGKFFDVSLFYTFLKITRTFKNVKYTIDPFSDINKIEIDNKKNEIKIIKKNILISNPDKKYKINISKKEYEEIIEDYKKHFLNKLDDFLDFIIYTRFTIDRKKSFLNLNAPSNWGKGFLMSIFNEDLEAGIRIEDTDLVEGKAGGLTETQFLNSFVLFIDEFKKFRNHLFKVTHTFLVEPKFSFRFEVDVFAKILLNADKSESFSYLIDEQISNRVLLIELDNASRLTDNKLFKKNKVKYKYAVAKYIYNYITKKFEELTKMGKEKANIEADKQLQKIYYKYSIKTNYNITDIIKENLYTFLLKTKEEEDKLTPSEQKIASSIYYNNYNFYITKPVTTIMNILELELDKTEYSKVAYKRGMLLKLLEKEIKAYKINKLTRKAIKISLDEIEEYLDKLEIFECNNNFKTPIDFIYSLRRFLDIRDDEFEIKNDEITFYTIQKYTLAELNEQLRQIYDCNKKEMLEQFANNIKVYSTLKEINKIYNEIPDEEKEVIEITEEELLNEL